MSQLPPETGKGHDYNNLRQQLLGSNNNNNDLRVPDCATTQAEPYAVYPVAISLGVTVVAIHIFPGGYGFAVNLTAAGNILAPSGATREMTKLSPCRIDVRGCWETLAIEICDPSGASEFLTPRRLSLIAYRHRETGGVAVCDPVVGRALLHCAGPVPNIAEIAAPGTSHATQEPYAVNDLPVAPYLVSPCQFGNSNEIEKSETVHTCHFVGPISNFTDDEEGLAHTAGYYEGPQTSDVLGVPDRGVEMPTGWAIVVSSDSEGERARLCMVEDYEFGDIHGPTWGPLHDDDHARYSTQGFLLTGKLHEATTLGAAFEEYYIEVGEQCPDVVRAQSQVELGGGQLAKLCREMITTQNPDTPRHFRCIMVKPERFFSDEYALGEAARERIRIADEEGLRWLAENPPPAEYR